MGSESSLVAKLETLPHAFDAVRAGSRHLVFEGDTVVHSEMGVLADVGDAVVGSPTVGLNFRTGGNMLDDEREQGVSVPLGHRDSEELSLVPSLYPAEYPLLGSHPLPPVILSLRESAFVNFDDLSRASDLGLTFVVGHADFPKEAEKVTGNNQFRLMT